MKRMMLTTTAMACLLLTVSAAAGSDVDINIGGMEIGIGGPPRLEFAGPPELLVIPGRNVYFMPDNNFDLFFYRGWWYRPYKGRWFRSDNYAGRWEDVREVPPALINLPPDYRTMPPRYYRVPYGEVRNNWERWEQERYWDRRAEERRMREREREERDIQPARDRYGYY
jgi:hypothetical protein